MRRVRNIEEIKEHYLTELCKGYHVLACKILGLIYFFFLLTISPLKVYGKLLSVIPLTQVKYRR
jgi:hypothetical protein